MTAPYEGFHNMVFSEESPSGAFLLRARREGLRDFGACMSPHTAWLICKGIETCRCATPINTEKVVLPGPSPPSSSAWATPAPPDPSHQLAGAAQAARAPAWYSASTSKGTRRTG